MRQPLAYARGTVQCPNVACFDPVGTPIAILQPEQRSQKIACQIFAFACDYQEG